MIIVRRRRTKARQRALAYHEAGHAVAMWFLKRRAIGYITIEPDLFSDGHVQDRLPLNEGDSRKQKKSNSIGRPSFRQEKEFVIFLAGEAAQRRFNPRSVRPRHGMSDWTNIMNSIKYVTLYQKENDAYFNWLLTWAEEFVKYRWPMIEDLAGELLTRPTIGDEDLKRWFRRWLRNELNKARIDDLKRNLQTEESRRFMNKFRRAFAPPKE